MYQIFELKLKPTEIDLRKNIDSINKLNWYLTAENIIKTDDNGLQYVLDTSHFTVKGLTGDLFPIEEGEWEPDDCPGREELIRVAITKLEKLPFHLEITEIRRIVKRA